MAREALAGHPRAADAELVISELVTNAILHSKSGSGGLLWVEIRRHPDSVWIEVADEGEPDDPASRRIPEEVSDFGRGLAVVNALAHAWGAHSEAKDFRSVWAELPSCTQEQHQHETQKAISRGV